MKHFEVFRELLKEEHLFHLIFFSFLWQFNCVKHSCLNLILPGLANKDTPILFVLNTPSVWHMGTHLQMCTLPALLCFTLSMAWMLWASLCLQDFCCCHAERGRTVIQMVLMKTRRHSISVLQNDPTQRFVLAVSDTMVLIVSDLSVFSASLLPLQLNGRMVPRELGLCQVVCILSPAWKWRLLYDQLSWIPLQWRREKKKSSSPIRKSTVDFL